MYRGGGGGEVGEGKGVINILVQGENFCPTIVIGFFNAYEGD